MDWFSIQFSHSQNDIVFEFLELLMNCVHWMPNKIVSASKSAFMREFHSIYHIVSES